MESNKVLAASWATKTQGRQACIERYQNSPVMHQNIPPECKPMLFEQGVVQKFEPSKKNVKQPRFKMGYGYSQGKLASDFTMAEALPKDGSEELGADQAAIDDKGDSSGDDSDKEKDLATALASSSIVASSDQDAAVGAAKTKADWVPNEAAESCFKCDKAFTLLRRRHHCRACGLLCCAECAPRTNKSSWMTKSKDESTYKRLCMDCAEGLGLMPSSVLSELKPDPAKMASYMASPKRLPMSPKLTGNDPMMPVEIKNTFLSVERSPSMDKLVHRATTSFPL